jgi:hypothetical protein
MNAGDLVIYKDYSYPRYRLNDKVGFITCVCKLDHKLDKKPIVLYFVYIENETLMLSKHYLDLL